MAKQSKAVAPAAANTAVATATDFEDFAGHGMENVTASDLLVPRLTIVQALSPQLKRAKPEFIDGAKVGDIVDVSMKELFESVTFLPVYYSKVWLEWAPRSSGKGLVAIHSTPDILDKCRRDEKNRPLLPNGNLISETAQWFGLNLSAGGRKSFIPFASTMLKRSKGWMMLATSEKLARADGSEFVAPLFYRTYTLTTAEESNAEGEWASWVVDRSKALPELEGWRSIKEEAIAFADALRKGELRADTTGMEGSGDVASGSEGAM